MINAILSDVFLKMLGMWTAGVLLAGFGWLYVDRRGALGILAQISGGLGLVWLVMLMLAIWDWPGR